MGKRRDDNRQGDRRVAVHISRKRAAPKFAEDQRLVESHGARAAAGMRRVGGNLNRVLMTVHLLLEDMGRHFCLTNKTLGDAAAQIDHA